MANLHTSAIRRTPWFRAFATNQTTTTANVDNILDSLPTVGRVIPGQTTDGIKFRGIEILPFGGDDDNDQFRLEFHGIQIISKWGKPGSTDFDFIHATLTRQFLTRKISDIDCTINTNALQAGTSGGLVGSGDSCCDVITQTPTTYGTALELEFGTAGLYQGAGNSVFGSYLQTNFGDQDYLWVFVDIDGGGGTAANEGNCLIRLFT